MASGGESRLSVGSRIEGLWAVIDARGEVDLHTASHLRRAINDLLAEGRYHIIVDLDAVDFMDSTGLGVLVGGVRRLRDHAGRLVLVRPSPSVKRVLAITGLDRVLTTYGTLDEALAADR